MEFNVCGSEHFELTLYGHDGNSAKVLKTDGNQCLIGSSL